VSQLTSLRALAVRQNRLAGLPAELGGLPQLRSLDARQNRLTGLPSARRPAAAALAAARRQQVRAWYQGAWPGACV